MDLPPEIRNMIYKLLLARPYLRNQYIFKSVYETPWGLGYSWVYDSFESTDTADTDILRLNRQIYLEACDVLFSEPVRTTLNYAGMMGHYPLDPKIETGCLRILT